MLESGFPSKMFSGVRFALVGFNPIDENTLRSKLLSGGGVDVGQYSQTCTHLIVDKLIYDDPICEAARSSRKVAVTGSWVDHSFDVGMLIDPNSVLYRPLRDLNGIPGAKALVVCLTGYQRQDREDIMTMVDLMGGQFSKPLVANRITHLICYKFEGEKYELAKRLKRIKLVNHRWLEDCLKNWKLLPEIDYEISGYELEIMEASARDSEDEAENASVKRANNSPLGLRVGAVAAVEISKSGEKDIPVVQTNSGAQDGSSFCTTSKGSWLTPKNMDRPLEAMVSTDVAAAQQHNCQRASTFQDTSTYASPIPVNKTSEQGMDRRETVDSTSINKSIRRHSSLATYSRKILQRSPETSTLGKESNGQNSSLRMDDKGLKASNAFSVSASKSYSSVERKTLFKDLEKIDKLHGEESPPLLPPAKITDGSVSSKGSQKVHHNSEASTSPLANLLLQELRPGSPKENLRPAPSINNPTECGEVGHKSPASVLSTKLLSSNVVPMEDAMSAAENIIPKCAPDEIPEKSSTEPMVENILFPEPRSGLPKQDLRVVTNIGGHTEGREGEHNLEVTDSATRLFTSNGGPMGSDVWNPKKGALDEVPERSITEPVMRRSSTSPESGLIGMKDKLETELPKKTAPRKCLGTKGRKKSPINQKGSLCLSEATPKDERTNCLKTGKVAAPVTDNGNQKEISSPVLFTEAVREMANAIDSRTEALKGMDSTNIKSCAPEEKDHIVNQDKLQAKTPEEADTEVEITMLEPELIDVQTEGPSDGALQLEVDKNESKRAKETTAGKSSLQSGKKENSSTAKIEKSSVKKRKKSRKEHDAKANDTVMKDMGDNYAKETTAGKSSLQSGKKENSSTAKIEKSSVKKRKKSRKEHDAKANDTVMKDMGDNYAKEKENVASENKSGKVCPGGDQIPVGGETLEKKDAETKDPNDAAVQSGVDKIRGKRRKEATVEKNKLQSRKKGSSTVEFGNTSVKKTKISKKDDTKANVAVMKSTGINSAGVKQNIAADKKSGDVSPDGAQRPVARKTVTRKETAAKCPSNAAMQLEADKSKHKHKKETTDEGSRLQSGKKRSSSTVEVGKSSVKKPKKSKKERGAKATDTVIEEVGDNSAEEKENIAVGTKPGREKNMVSGKPLARKEAAKSAKTGKKADKESKRAGSKTLASSKILQDQEQEPKYFIVSGPRAQRKEYQQIIKCLKGKCCRDSHQWSYQATHFIAPEIRRTEKFFAAAASGSWILKTDYVADSKEAGKLLPEEPYEWHSTGLSVDGAINLESPRKWRLLREQTGHGALYGMRIVVYGDCTIPSLDTLKRAVKAGDGTILATAPPYTRFLNQNTDFALISPGMPIDDVWIQEFIRHEIPCVLSDYVVEYVCKPGYALDKHVLYNTHSWAGRSFNKMQLSANL